MTRSHCAWDSKHKYIWTHYDFTVDDVLKGPPESTITVSEPGGSLNGIHQQFSGALPYPLAEHDVLFLYRTPIGYLRTVGGPQGKYLFDNRNPESAGTMQALKATVRRLLRTPKTGAAQ